MNEYDTDELVEEPSEDEIEVSLDNEAGEDYVDEDKYNFKGAVRKARVTLRELKEKEDGFRNRMRAGEKISTGDMTGNWTLHSLDYIYFFRDALQEDYDSFDYDFYDSIGVYCFDDSNLAEFTLSLSGKGDLTFSMALPEMASRQVDLVTALCSDPQEYNDEIHIVVDIDIACLGPGLMWMKINAADLSREESYDIEFYASHDGRSQEEIFEGAGEYATP